MLCVGTLQQGYPLLLHEGRTRVVIRNYAIRGGAAGPHGSVSYLHRANGPGPAPRSGIGPMTPRVPEEGKLRANSRGLGPPKGVRDLPRPSGPPTRVEPTYRRLGGSGSATCSAGAGAGLPVEDSPTHRIQCGWLRRALPPRHAGQPLSGLTVDRVLPRYTVQPHPRRARLPH